MLMRHFLAALLVLAGLLLGAARAEVPVPPLKARVTDLTGTLNAQQKGELEARIAAYEAKRGSQIAVLLLPTTQPEEIEQYSIRVAEAWKIGRKGVDDGLILVVAKDDRRLRIEVGYGLEGRIPDSLARRVIDERITPRFRDGDFYGGVRDGVEQLIQLAEGEQLPPPQAKVMSDARNFFGANPVVAFILAMFAGFVLKAIFGRLPGSLLTGAGVGVIALLLFGIGIAFFAAIVAFIFTYANTDSGGGGGGHSSSGGSWSGGSSSSSSSSWGGGGGGSFGGGGSSGRW
jgi:uncharacterized protein